MGPGVPCPGSSSFPPSPRLVGCRWGRSLGWLAPGSRAVRAGPPSPTTASPPSPHPGPCARSAGSCPAGAPRFLLRVTVWGHGPANRASSWRCGAVNHMCEQSRHRAPLTEAKGVRVLRVSWSHGPSSGAPCTPRPRLGSPGAVPSPHAGVSARWARREPRSGSLDQSRARGPGRQARAPGDAARGMDGAQACDGKSGRRSGAGVSGRGLRGWGWLGHRGGTPGRWRARAERGPGPSRWGTGSPSLQPCLMPGDSVC